MKEKKLTYEDAYQRLQEIVNRLEDGHTDLGELSEMVKEGKQLVAFCRAELVKEETEISQLLEDGER